MVFHHLASVFTAATGEFYCRHLLPAERLRGRCRRHLLPAGEHERPGGVVRRAALRRTWRRRSPRGRAQPPSRFRIPSRRYPATSPRTSLHFGLVQIDGEQFTYFRAVECRQHPLQKLIQLYKVQCAQNATTPANNTVNATVVTQNNFKPSYPWPRSRRR